MKEALHDIQNPSWEPKVGVGQETETDREKQRKK